MDDMEKLFDLSTEVVLDGLNDGLPKLCKAHFKEKKDFGTHAYYFTNQKGEIICVSYSHDIILDSWKVYKRLFE